MIKIILKCTLAAALLATGLTSGCKKEKEQAEKHTTDVPGDEKGAQTAYLPAQIGSGTSAMVFSYLNDQLLSKIEYGDGRSAVLTCNTKNQPLQLEKFSGEDLIYSSQYTLDANGSVIRADLFAVNHDEYESAGYYTLEYNTDHQLTHVKNFNLQNKMLNETVETYDQSGNLITEQSTSPQQTINYTYDIKGALFKNAVYADLFFLETKELLLLSRFNNVLTSSNTAKATGNQSYTYVYNAQGYPETIHSLTGGTTLPYQVLYK